MKGQLLMKKKYIFLVLALAVTAFIFSNSMQSADSSSKVSMGFLGIISHVAAPLGITLTHHLIRKAAHFTEFFTQGALWALFFKNTRLQFRGGAIYAAFFGLLTACCDEYIQLFSPGRGSAVSDVFIDFSGTCCALIIIGGLLFLKRRCSK